ncbi:Ankyrin and HET domain-containing protein [Colletotrichum tofieldiae]|uniref:Ankyrin and HET domain-containing protein n=1 Tax=Colletotrichum tofieldiae TaxID=708197 RepID=A0A166SLN9_9PEZI|nr:Ankyrin and HET domain-containing protein [Colletotrichum tofieldiae]
MIPFLKRQVTGIRIQGPAEVVDPRHRVYGPLPVGLGEIRVLKLQPGRSVSSPVEVSLCIAKLGDPSTHYDALSYRWGDSNDKETIRVNRKALKVTRSLATALRYLRRPDQEVILWADSVCIDQGNDAERNMQVALMGDIYRMADCVRIWLGEGGDDTAQAMQLVNDCNGFPDMDVMVEQVVGDERGAIGLAELLRRPYWDRMWVFQEILLSKLGYVHCGTYNAPFDTFVYMDIVSSKPQLWPDRRTSPAWIFDLRRAFFNISQFTITPGELDNLDYILMVTRVLQASDPRDKLFALMGTCDMASYLTIDYRKTFRDIYIEFTKKHSQLTGRLSLVLTAGWRNPQNKDDEKLPSWTPDYRGSPPESDIYAGSAMAGVFDASNGRCFSDEYLESDLSLGALRTQGFIIDTIESMAPLLRGDDGRSQVLWTFGFQRYEDDPSGKPKFQALYETISFDLDGVREADDEEGRAHKKDRQRKHLLGFIHDADVQYCNSSTDKMDNSINWESFLGRSETKDLDSIVRTYEQLKSSDPGTLAEYRNMFIKKYNANAGKISSVFVTRENRCGRSNYTIQPGDVIAVLFGSDLPVVLRGDGPCYKFIGGAYVSGMMYGEMKDNFSIGLRAESIILI